MVSNFILSCSYLSVVYNLFILFIFFRGVTEQWTLDEQDEFHENSIPILRVECSCIYNNL